MIFNCPFECGYNTHHPALCPRGSGSTSPATATSTVNDDEASDEVASLLVVAQPSQANLSVSSASSPSSATPTSTNSHDKTSSMPVSRPPEAPSTEIDLLKPPSARNVVIKTSNNDDTAAHSTRKLCRSSSTTTDYTHYPQRARFIPELFDKIASLDVLNHAELVHANDGVESQTREKTDAKTSPTPTTPSPPFLLVVCLFSEILLLAINA